MSTGDQSLHIYLPEGELRAYDIPATFRTESGHFRGETTYTLDGINDLNSLHASLLEGRRNNRFTDATPLPTPLEASV